jgi:DNA-binding MarR family transcriptional regulator
MPDGKLMVPGIDDLQNCTCSNLRQASRVVTQFFEQALEPASLKITQLPVLVAATTKGPLPMSKLAEELVMDRTTLTRNLQPLQRAGLIRISPGDDRRARMVSVTEKGIDALERAVPLWREAQTAMVDHLGRFQWGVLMDNLRATVHATRDEAA